MQEFLKACHAVVQDADTKNLATLMGMPSISLLQRANAEYDNAWFNVKHLYALMLHSEDMRPLHALAGEFGYVITRTEAPAAIDVHQALGRVALEFAELTVETHSAMSDGRVDQVERARLMREISQIKAAIEQYEASIKAA